MHLGRAEERLSEQPEVAELFRRARDEASAAIAELRDLARGIAPPVLADRGLEAAVVRRSAAARRSPSRSTRALDRRPLPVLETAAYFVVAESLTNVAKHAPAGVGPRDDPARRRAPARRRGRRRARRRGARAAAG